MSQQGRSGPLRAFSKVSQMVGTSGRLLSRLVSQPPIEHVEASFYPPPQPDEVDDERERIGHTQQ